MYSLDFLLCHISLICELLQEGYGVFTSPVTGDDYIHVGRSVVDSRDNTVFPSTLYAARERKKLAVGRGRGRGK